MKMGWFAAVLRCLLVLGVKNKERLMQSVLFFNRFSLPENGYLKNITKRISNMEKKTISLLLGSFGLVTGVAFLI